MKGGECVAQGGSERGGGERVGADEIGEVAAERGGVGLGGTANLRDVTAGAGVATGRKKEERDHDIAGVKTGSAELGGEKRVVVRVGGAFHRGGGEGTDLGAEEEADFVGDLVAQCGRGGRGAA